MILKSVKLRGFKGIKSGMGIDEIFIDLASLPEGLIAITGANGAGKTTLMDNLHPYRLMPYKIRKSKEWSPAAFSFYDQVSGTDGMKELCFEMNGIDYRSLILIDAEKRRQECYLYRLDNGQQIPINDGKSKTYDSAIEEICGSPQLFFTSVYRCQSAKNLSDYTRGDVMQIISELLNVDHIKEQSDKCSKVVSALSSKLVLIRDRISTLSIEADAAQGLSVEIRDKQDEISRNRIAYLKAESDLNYVRSEITKFRELQVAQESESARLEMLKSQLIIEEKRLADGEINITKVADNIQRKILEQTSIKDQSIFALQEKITRAEKIVSGSVAIREAVSKESDLVDTLAESKVSLARLQVDYDAAIAKQSSLSLQHNMLQERIRVATAESSKLNGIDCRGDGSINSSCRFIKDAAVSKESLPTLKSELFDISIDLDHITKVADVAKKSLSICRAEITVNEGYLEEARRFTRLLPELELAESNIIAFRQDIVSVSVSFAEALNVLESESIDLAMDWQLEKREQIALIEDLKAKIAIFPMINDLSDILKSLSGREATERFTVNSIDSTIRNIELIIASLQTKLESANLKLGGLVDLKEKDQKLSTEITKYSFLQRACSNSGIIALELDDAAPTIAGIVNDLLRACYGSRFAIRLDTQAIKVDGNLRETFDIIVFDSESGDERSLIEMSGGQTAIIEDAVTRGICLFNIHRAERVYGTLFCDEKDGALDFERKLEFLRVKREALRVGSHSREFFISQTSDLVDMADDRIVLGVGGKIIC